MARKLYSSTDGKYKFYIRESQIESMEDYCSNSYPNEVGGSLIGLYNPGRSAAMLKSVIGPSRDSKAGSNWFERGIEGLSILFNTLWNEEKLFNIGEWHFHPNGTPDFSTQDLRQMVKLSKSRSYNCKTPIMIIISQLSEDSEMVAKVYVLDKQSSFVELEEIQ